jgi:hypothetical protein
MESKLMPSFCKPRLIAAIACLLLGVVSGSAQSVEQHIGGRDGIDSPSTRPSGSSGNFELVPLFQNADSQSIMLELPSGAAYGFTKSVHRANGINLMLHYSPSDGIFHSVDVKADVRCKDDCPNILLSIENIAIPGDHQTAADRHAAGAMRILESSKRSGNPKVHISDVDAGGFTHAIEERVETNDPNLVIVERSYFRKAIDRDHYDLFASCTLWTKVHGCKLNFSLPCYPHVAIQTSLYPPFEHLEESEKVRAAASRFVASIVDDENCRSAR